MTFLCANFGSSRNWKYRTKNCALFCVWSSILTRNVEYPISDCSIPHYSSSAYYQLLKLLAGWYVGKHRTRERILKIPHDSFPVHIVVPVATLGRKVHGMTGGADHVSTLDDRGPRRRYRINIREWRADSVSGWNRFSSAVQKRLGCLDSVICIFDLIVCVYIQSPKVSSSPLPCQE